MKIINLGLRYFKPFEIADFLTDDAAIVAYLELCTQDADLKVLQSAVLDVLKAISRTRREGCV